MKKKNYESYADFCKTSASAKRIKITELLQQGEMTVTDIQTRLGVTRAHTSMLLSDMRMKGILKTRRSGVNIYYEIANDKVAHICSVMQQSLAQLYG